MKFSVFQSSRQGPRPYNQDRLAYSYSKEALLLVVADGMGGHRHGEVAAQFAVKMLTDEFQKNALPSLKDPELFLRTQILHIHNAIDKIRLKNGLLESPRTTIVAAIVQHNHIVSAHVGDSRLYHFRKNQLIFRTEDHSLVQMLYRNGSITKSEMHAHPDKHKIYNCIGGDTPPLVQVNSKTPLREGDTIVLCTDGVWSNFDDNEINDILQTGPLNITLPKLLDVSEENAGFDGDNMSAIALRLGEDVNKNLTISTGTLPLGEITTILNPNNYQTTIRDDEESKNDLTDEEIEIAIAEIQVALSKTKK